MSRPYPIVEYAQKIGKNTSEFTTKDLVAYMKWWMKEKPRKDLLTVTPEQRKKYNKDVAAVKKFQDAQTSRLSGGQMEDINEDNEGTWEGVDDEIRANLNCNEEEVENEIVVEMGLTKIDVDALLWALNEIFENYDLTGSTHDRALSDLQESLKGVE